MGRLIISDHPLIQHKMAMLRNKETGPKEFRELVNEVAMLLCYDASRDLPLTGVKIYTPLGTADCKMIMEKQLCIAAILRAGITMTEGLLRLMPTAKVGHIGIYRDPETLMPIEYYCKLPNDVHERDVFLVDPMLATGGTTAAAIGFIKDRGVTNIKCLCLIASKEGVSVVHSQYPDVEIYTAAYDEELNEAGYIVPGLGDAGDRIFGTK